MPNKNIGEEIAKAREKASLSQRQLAKLIGISNAELSKIESGEREIPNPKILRKMSKHIDLNYYEMLRIIGLGAKGTPLNPFIENYYKNLMGDELDNAWMMAKSSIKNNDVIIKSINKQLENKKIDQEMKDNLIDTLQDLTYQNETNQMIIDILDENKFKEAKKNAKNKNVFK